MGGEWTLLGLRRNRSPSSGGFRLCGSRMRVLVRWDQVRLAFYCKVGGSLRSTG